MTSTSESRTPGQRKRRFQRQPEGRIQLTERDTAVIRAVYRYRFVRSTHLMALFDGNQGLLRRLGELYHHGYLDRPREQIEFYRDAGSKPMVYGLGNQGADYLALYGGVSRGKIDWTAKNQSAKQLFIEHTLLVSDVLVGLELACRASGRVRLIPPEEILAGAPEATQKSQKPFQWTVTCDYQHERGVALGVIPDAVFGLQYLDKPEGRNRAFFFLEADRSTMPVVRPSARQTSFLRKLTAYYATDKQGLLADLFNIRRFRVLTVTSNAERVNHLVQVTRSLNGGVGLKMFLYTDEPTLHSAPDLLQLDWRNGQDGELIRLG